MMLSQKMSKNCSTPPSSTLRPTPDDALDAPHEELQRTLGGVHLVLGVIDLAVLEQRRHHVAAQHVHDAPAARVVEEVGRPPKMLKCLVGRAYGLAHPCVAVHALLSVGSQKRQRLLGLLPFA